MCKTCHCEPWHRTTHKWPLRQRPTCDWVLRSFSCSSMRRFWCSICFSFTCFSCSLCGGETEAEGCSIQYYWHKKNLFFKTYNAVFDCNICNHFPLCACACACTQSVCVGKDNVHICMQWLYECVFMCVGSVHMQVQQYLIRHISKTSMHFCLHVCLSICMTACSSLCITNKRHISHTQSYNKRHSSYTKLCRKHHHLLDNCLQCLTERHWPAIHLVEIHLMWDVGRGLQ